LANIPLLKREVLMNCMNKKDISIPYILFRDEIETKNEKNQKSG
jgi:hypothetical protein